MAKAKKINKRGIARAHFFATVGDLARWRGRTAIFKDQRLETDRRACRVRVTDHE